MTYLKEVQGTGIGKGRPELRDPAVRGVSPMAWRMLSRSELPVALRKSQRRRAVLGNDAHAFILGTQSHTTAAIERNTARDAAQLTPAVGLLESAPSRGRVHRYPTIDSWFRNLS